MNSAQRVLFRKKLLGLLLISLLGTLLSFVLQSFNFGEKFESRLWDKRLEAIAARSTPDPQIKLIVVDQSALNLMAESSITWPWPRVMWQPVLEFLNHVGARGAAFDLIFTEESRTGLLDDQEFAAAIDASRLPIISAVVPGADSAGSSPDRVRQLSQRLIELGQGQDFQDPPRIPEQTGLLTPIPEIIAASDGFGSVWGQPDADALFRHHLPAVRAAGLKLSSLPFALYRKLYPDDDGRWLSDFYDQQGRLTLRFNGGARAYSMIGYNAILNACKLLALPACRETPLEADPATRKQIESETARLLAEFKNSLVLIGVDAPALMDYRPTPLAEKAPGIEVNATVLDNLLNRQFIRRIGISNPLYQLVCLLLTSATAALLLFVSSGYLAAIGAFLLFSGAVLIAYLFALNGFWVPMLWPLLSMALAGTAAMGLQYALEGRQLRFVRGAFRQYVSEAVLDKITENPAALSLGGEKRELTIFFSDIAGFTTLSENVEPTALVELLNVYLTAMTRIIMKHGGTVDKYVGDAIVAFWNAPLPDADHALHGVRAALECQRTLAEMAPQFRNDFGVDLRARVGLHTGVVTVGNFGSAERFNYTVIGDAANLASRLEGSNKYFGTSTLISQATRDAVGDALRARKIGTIRVVGRAETVTVFEPLALEPDVSNWNFESFEAAMALFESRRLDEAERAFAKLSSDPVAMVYSRRIQHELAQGASRGIAESWTAVWNLTEK